MAALRASPSTSARCGGAVGPSRKPSTRHASAGGWRSARTARRPARFERCRPERSISAAEIMRTLICAAQPTTAWKSASRSSWETCLESFSRGERTNPCAAQRLVVEKHAGDDERPGERAAARLVRARDVADTEASIVCEKPLAGRSRHPPRIDASSVGARGRAPSFPLSFASSRASRAARRRPSPARASRSWASGAGKVRSTPMPNDCFRTVNVSRKPEPWRLMQMPSKTWIR